jgi:hypothetical protein
LYIPKETHNLTNPHLSYQFMSRCAFFPLEDPEVENDKIISAQSDRQKWEECTETVSEEKDIDF